MKVLVFLTALVLNHSIQIESKIFPTVAYAKFVPQNIPPFASSLTYYRSYPKTFLAPPTGILPPYLPSFNTLPHVHSFNPHSTFGITHGPPLVPTFRNLVAPHLHAGFHAAAHPVLPHAHIGPVVPQVHASPVVPHIHATPAVPHLHAAAAAPHLHPAQPIVPHIHTTQPLPHVHAGVAPYSPHIHTNPYLHETPVEPHLHPAVPQFPGSPLEPHLHPLPLVHPTQGVIPLLRAPFIPHGHLK